MANKFINNFFIDLAFAAIVLLDRGEVSGIKGKWKGKKQDMGSDFCADIGEIEVNAEEEVLTKMLKYIAAVGDPYRFRVGKTKVRVTFGDRLALSVQTGLEKISRRKP